MERIVLLCARKRTKGVLLSIMALFSGLLVTACGSGNGATAGVASTASTGTGDNTPRRQLPSADEVAKSSDYLKVAVKYVSYRSANGTVVADEQSVRDMTIKLSEVWAQCNIGFELTQYEVVEPATLNLPFNPGSYSEIDKARMKFQDDTHILLMGTGTWNRSDGTLASANCYSSFPGDQAEGVICEQSAAVNSTLLAHEVGHWFYLTHTTTGTNLMEPLVGSGDSAITAAQCELARRTVGESRRNSVL